jgi:SAM-dependent MidA family methyltransferase
MPISPVEPNPGVVRFDHFMHAALYGGDGFYATGHGAGTSRDFLTSPEVGSLFGAVLAERMDAEWRRLGEPTVFTVVEVGAGPGTLARTVFAARPACLDALQYVMVDIAPGMRALQADHLPLDRVQSVESLDVVADLVAPIVGMVIANELLDNVPCRVLRFDADLRDWFEVCVVQDTATGKLGEHLVSADSNVAALLSQLVPDPTNGSEVPLQSQAGEVLNAMANLLSNGALVVLDYMRPSTKEFADLPRAEWLRTYDRHVKGSNPLLAPGQTDITVDVAVDQMVSAVGQPMHSRSQAAALAAWGLQDVLERSARQWSSRASDYDLNALRARSHVAEAVVLTDETGLGGFTVLEWSR